MRSTNMSWFKDKNSKNTSKRKPKATNRISGQRLHSGEKLGYQLVICEGHERYPANKEEYFDTYEEADEALFELHEEIKNLRDDWDDYGDDDIELQIDFCAYDKNGGRVIEENVSGEVKMDPAPTTPIEIDPVPETPKRSVSTSNQENVVKLQVGISLYPDEKLGYAPYIIDQEDGHYLHNLDDDTKVKCWDTFEEAEEAGKKLLLSDECKLCHCPGIAINLCAYGDTYTRVILADCNYDVLRKMNWIE